MKKFVSITLSVLFIFFTQALGQNVGIGTNTPLARFHVSDSSVVFSGTGFVSLPAGNPPVSGAGRRMMWYADKAAFRTGYVNASHWDNDSIGAYSFAAGFDVKAKGISSVSLGISTSALANYSTATGINTVASGEYSTAMGFYSLASGSAASAIGAGTVAKATGSLAVGINNDTNDVADPSILSPSDRLFQIGNGILARSNAMTVLRNGFVGFGTTTPQTLLHLKSINSNPVIIDGGDNMWVTLAENGINRGYIGSYAGNPDDVELGTYGGTTGNVHLTTNNSPKLTIINNGNIGIGTTNPAFKLDVADRMRIRSGGGFSTAGLYLNSNDNSQSPAFIGMDDDTHVGFWGSGTGWKFTMNTQTGALKVNGNEGNSGQVLQSNGSSSPPGWINAPKYYFFERPPGGVVTVTTSFQPIAPVDAQTFTVDFTSTLIITFNVDMFTAISETEVQEPWITFSLSGLLSYRTENYSMLKPQPGTFIGHQATTTKYIPNVAPGTYTIDFNIRKMNAGGTLTYSNAQVIVQAIP